MSETYESTTQEEYDNFKSTIGKTKTSKSYDDFVRNLK